MISAEAIHAADELASSLRHETLPRLGLVDVGEGSRLAFELAVRVTLGDLCRFTDWERAGIAVPTERWRRLCDDLTRLHRMATGATSPTGSQ